MSKTDKQQRKSMKLLREEIRQEVAKNYKDRISELERENATLREKYVNAERENLNLRIKLDKASKPSVPLDDLAGSVFSAFVRALGDTPVYTEENKG